MSVSNNYSVNRKRTFSSSMILFDSVLTATNSTCFDNNVQLPERKKSVKERMQVFSSTATHHQIATDTTTTTTSIPHRVSSQRSVPAFLHKLFK